MREQGTCRNCGYVSEHRRMDCIYSVFGTALCPDCMYEALHLIDELRRAEGSSVAICSDNAEPDGWGGVVEVIAEWTEWRAHMVFGESALDALRNAAREAGLIE